jgi:hypothetical protein
MEILLRYEKSNENEGKREKKVNSKQLQLAAQTRSS